MLNKRPTFNVILALFGGLTPSCTIKSPKLKLTRQVRQLVVDSQMAAEECNALYNTTGEINGRLAAADRALMNAKNSGAADDLVANAQAGFDAVQKELNSVVARVNALNDKQFDTLKAQVSLIVNIPNSSDGQPVGTDQIDWDECDQDELQEAVSFFVNGPKK